MLKNTIVYVENILFMLKTLVESKTNIPVLNSWPQEWHFWLNCWSKHDGQNSLSSLIPNVWLINDLAQFAHLKHDSCQCLLLYETS